MKKLLVCVLVFGLSAVTADAALLGLSFSGSDSASLAPNGTATLDVWLDLADGQQLSGLGFAFEAAPGLSMTATSIESDAVASGWVDSSTSMPIVPGNGHGFAAFKPATGTLLAGELGTLIGTIDITNTGGATSGSVELAIEHTSVSVIDQDGSFYPYNGAGNFGSTWGYDSYGSPGTSPVPPFDPGQERDALTVNFTPEPASLALLAIGGVALLRRRR